jgi:MFS family permease
VILAMGLLAPFAGSLATRWPLRRLMLIGGLLDLAGYLVLTQLHDIGWMLACYAFLIGPGTLLYGSLSCAMLVSRWFDQRRGLALGIANMPMLVMLMPLATSALLEHHPVAVVHGGIALAIALSLPLLLLVRERAPRRVSATASTPVTIAGTLDAPPLRQAELLADVRFRRACIAVGLAVAGGTLLVAHLVPMMIARGVPPLQASLLLSVAGGAGVVGSFTLGVLSDRFGARRTLAGATALQAVLWTGLLLPLPVTALFVLIFLNGCCSGGLSSAFSTLLGTLFGPETFGRAYGLASLLTVPFTFISAPLAGLLYDQRHSYVLPVVLQVFAFLTAATLLATLHRAGRSASTVAP